MAAIYGHAVVFVCLGDAVVSMRVVVLGFVAGAAVVVMASLEALRLANPHRVADESTTHLLASPRCL